MASLQFRRGRTFHDFTELIACTYRERMYNQASPHRYSHIANSTFTSASQTHCHHSPPLIRKRQNTHTLYNHRQCHRNTSPQITHLSPAKSLHPTPPTLKLNSTPNLADVRYITREYALLCYLRWISSV
jgi:hypothetical protein